MNEDEPNFNNDEELSEDESSQELNKIVPFDELEDFEISELDIESINEVIKNVIENMSEELLLTVPQSLIPTVIEAHEEVVKNMYGTLPSELTELIMQNINEVQKSISETISNFFPISTFIPHFTEIFSELSEDDDQIWEKIIGHESYSFLPVYRISVDENIDEKDLFPAIIKRETEILQTAKYSLGKLDKSDLLKPLFEEAITTVEKGQYLAGQSFLANIYEIIRFNRFENKDTIYPFPHVLRTYVQLRDCVRYILSKNTSDDVKLALMTIYVFSNTKNLNDDHIPRQITSRHATAHLGAAYFSRYNCLCFLLYLSEVFDLVYKLESVPKSLIKPKLEWSS